ncbi:MAG: 2Fe-2S iron-sulfur cluster-binding protein [Myxococcota bacterium]|nr:2Fe-2S iron-sulfur cluster-binding protein [Myxococcota bacterium]
MPKLELVRRIDGEARILEIQVLGGTSLLSAARSAGLPVARACGERTLCGRCAMRVIEGEEALSPESDGERWAKRRNRVDPEERLSCCSQVHGDARVTATYW